MLRIFDSLKSLISPELEAKAASMLGEDSSKVSAAVSGITASMLAALLQKGDSTAMKNVLEDAGKSNILSDLKGIFNDNLSLKQKSVGTDFLNSLLGNKKNEFDNVISATTGVAQGSACKLTGMLAPIVAGFLGNKLATNGYSMSGLISQLNEEKHSFMGFVPSGIANIFGLSSVSDMGSKITTKNADMGKTVYATPDTPKKGSGWWKWLLLLVLLLLLFFWWRSCNRAPRNEYVEYDEAVVVDTTANRTVAPVTTDNRSRNDYELPNGTRINAYRGGIEDRMITFLNSDDYRNATAEDLRDRRFEFDDIRFEFGSGTELMGNSRQQINNIISILKSYPNAKVSIVGMADKKGTDEANMAISRERAKTIENMLENGGVGSQVIRVTGVGDQYAEHSAGESDDVRSEDRDIALVFVK